MPLLPAPRPDEAAGDLARRRARRAGLLFLILLPATIWLFAGLVHVWPPIAALEGAAFMIAAAFLGLLLAGLPVVTVVTFLVAVWYGVQSVYRPHTRETPLIDKLLVGLGVVVWFAPALGLIGMIGRAILNGSIAFKRPDRVYFMATDPIAFWQSMGFLLIVAGAGLPCLAFLARQAEASPLKLKEYGGFLQPFPFNRSSPAAQPALAQAQGGGVRRLAQGQSGLMARRRIQLHLEAHQFIAAKCVDIHFLAWRAAHQHGVKLTTAHPQTIQRNQDITR